MKNRKKSITALLLAITLLLSLCPAVFAEEPEAETETEAATEIETEAEEAIYIRTADDLLELAKKLHARYLVAG